MAEESIRPRGENRREATAVSGEVRVPDREDALVKAVQPALIDRPRDRRLRISERADQLANRNNAVLSSGQLSQWRVPTVPRLQA
jgi:hypothetical protein